MSARKCLCGSQTAITPEPERRKRSRKFGVRFGVRCGLPYRRKFTTNILPTRLLNNSSKVFVYSMSQRFLNPL